jgi:ribosomal-protein-alanine N-acetyltransferase
MPIRGDLRLETSRLELVPFSSALIDAIADRIAAAKVIGAAVPQDWPDDELSGLLAIYAGRLAEAAVRPGFGPWVVISRDASSVVGSAGFVGPPNEQREVELGFGIHPDFRNRGYATEAARALVVWGLAQPSVETIVARCDPRNAQSARVLEKIGMTRLAERDSLLHWTTLSEARSR